MSFIRTLLFIILCHQLWNKISIWILEQSKFVCKFSRQVTVQSLNVSHCIIVANVFSFVIQNQPPIYRSVREQEQQIYLCLAHVLLHQTQLRVPEPYFQKLFCSTSYHTNIVGNLFSAYRKQYPSIAPHPNSQSSSLPTIQPILPTHTVITTIIINYPSP